MIHVNFFKGIDVDFRQFMGRGTIFVFSHKRGTIYDTN